MITRISSLIFISVLFCYELPWQSVSVGVMGNNTNSATFNNKNILYGLDMLNLSLDMDEINGREELSISATILMPKIGYKYNMRTKNMLSTYYVGELYTVIPIISIETNDSEVNADLDDATSDMQDTADLLGLRLSYGIKYDFNEQLSICADTGVNFLFNNLELGNVDIKARIGNTFTKLSINFTF